MYICIYIYITCVYTYIYIYILFFYYTERKRSDILYPVWEYTHKGFTSTSPPTFPYVPSAAALAWAGWAGVKPLWVYFHIHPKGSTPGEQGV